MIIGLDWRRFTLLDLVVWSMVGFTAANTATYTPAGIPNNKDSDKQDSSIALTNSNAVLIHEDVVLASRDGQCIGTTNEGPKDLIQWSKPSVSFPGSFGHSNVTSVSLEVLAPSLLMSQSLKTFYEDIQTAISNIITTAPVKYISLAVGKLQIILSCVKEIPWAVIQTILNIMQMWTRMGFPTLPFMVVYAVRACVEFVILADVFVVGMQHAYGLVERPLVAVIT